ncbi:putative short chain dehydrogenase/reductase [Xylariaceae sp. FL0804]|nr:putative short chain dehydrogenase/reductase [Xylariaceae sp. FL0804]
MGSDKRVVFITGANSGIGYETVLALARHSAEFEIVLGARSVEKGEAALREMRAQHGGGALKSAITVQAMDVTDSGSVAAARDALDARFGQLDVLLNNAGSIVHGEEAAIANADRRGEALRRSFETNAVGPMLATEALEPLLRRSARPYVVYVSTDQGSITLRLDPESKWGHLKGEPYRISKAALNMAPACHRHEFAAWGCRVCACSPGFCVSNLTGPAGREMRIKLGARSADAPAAELRDLVLGARDADFEQNAMINLEGGLLPW